MIVRHMNLANGDPTEGMMSHSDVIVNERELCELSELVSPDLHCAFAYLNTPSKGSHMRDSVVHMAKVLERLKTFAEERKLTDCKLSEYVATASELLESKHENPVDEYLTAKSAYKNITRILGRLSRMATCDTKHNG